MTKRFKKIQNFDTKQFIEAFEQDLLEEQEGDIFTQFGLERARSQDQINDVEEAFMSGYIEG